MHLVAGGERQMPRTLLEVGHQPSQPRVGGAAVPGQRAVIRKRGEERVGEADPVAVEAHDPLVDRYGERGVPIDELHGRGRERGGVKEQRQDVG